MPATLQITDTVKLTALKHLAAGRDKEFAAIACGITGNQVLDIASKHGWPDRDKIAWAVDVLEKQLRDEATDDTLPPPSADDRERFTPLDPPVPRPLATGRVVRNPTTPAAAPRPASPARPAAPAADGDRLGQAIATARSSGSKRLERLADKLTDARDTLLAEVGEWQAKAAERKAAEQAKAANAARIAELKAELAKLQTSAKTNRTGRATANTSRSKVIRTWAAEQGLHVGAVGRVPAGIVDAYDKAHPGT